MLEYIRRLRIAGALCIIKLKIVFCDEVILMKKVFSAVLLLILVFALSVNAFASVTKVDEFKLSYEVPEGWFVITRDTPEIAEVFNYYLYYDGTMSYMEELGLYLYLLSPDATDEITFQLEHTEDYEGLEGLSDFALKSNCRDVEKMWSDSGFENCSAEVYEGAVTTFVVARYDFESEGSRVYGLDYIGYVDGIYQIISLFSYDGEISAEDEEIMLNIADSIESENVVPENASSDSGFVRSLIKSARRLVPILIAAIGGSFAWVRKKLSKKASAETEIPSSEPVPMDNIEEIVSGGEEIPEEQPISGYCCSSCGSPLSEKDSVCPLCGKKIK